MANRTRYDHDFKTGAVELALNSEKPVANIAEELGIKPSLLYSWLKKERQPEEVKAAMAHLQQQEAEIAKLKRELKVAREERDILKKAAAYFAKEHK